MVDARRLPDLFVSLPGKPSSGSSGSPRRLLAWRAQISGGIEFSKSFSLFRDMYPISFFVTLLGASFTTTVVNAAAPPNIVYLVIDDWGWANFSPHRINFTQGNDEFLTPQLAALANEGLLLNRFYGHKFCGPSRASIQTGRNPIHVSVLDSALDAYNLKDPVSGFMGIPRTSCRHSAPAPKKFQPR